MSGLCIVLFILSVTCSWTQELSRPEKNFEHLWKTMDEEYGIFLPKSIDWDLLYKVYRPKVTPETIDEELRIGISFLPIQQIPCNFPHFPPVNMLRKGYHTQNSEVKESKSSTNPPKSSNRYVLARLRPFPALLGCHREFLLDIMGRRRPFGLELLDHLLDQRTEVPILSLEALLVFSKEPLKIVKEYSVENGVFRMTLAIDPWHSRKDDSQNGPGSSARAFFCRPA